jgi:hypothetical protein
VENWWTKIADSKFDGKTNRDMVTSQHQLEFQHQENTLVLRVFGYIAPIVNNSDQLLHFNSDYVTSTLHQGADIPGLTGP